MKDQIYLSDTNVDISENVIANIARVAAEEIEGVTHSSKSVTATITDIFAKNKSSQGIRVESEHDTISVDISVELTYGADIQEVGRKIQENVKTTVESMTGLHVREVNVLVTGLSVTTTSRD